MSPTVPIEDQLVPAFVEYSQTPFPFVIPVIATPSTAPLSGSVTDVPSIPDTRSPVLPVSSSVIEVNVGAEAVNVGALLAK